MRILALSLIFLVITCCLGGCSGRRDKGSEDGEVVESEPQSLQVSRKHVEQELSLFVNSYYNDSYDIAKLQIGEPFIIYFAGREQQDEIYEFPIIDLEKRKVLCVAEVSSAYGVSNYSVDFQFSYVEILNKLNYADQSENILIFRVNREVYFENRDGLYNDSGLAIQKITDLSDDEAYFVSLSFEEKNNKIRNRMNNMNPSELPVLSSEEVNNAVMK